MGKTQPPKKRGTKQEIAEWLGVSVRTIDDYVDRLQLKPDSLGKYAVLSCYKEHAQREENDPRRNTVADGDEPPIRTWGDVEKRERVKKIRIEIQSLRDELVPIDEVRATLSAHVAAVRGALSNFVEHVAAGKRDAKLLTWAEQARDAALRGIQDNIRDES